MPPLSLTPRSRPRDDRRAGTERAREGLAGVARKRGSERDAQAVHCGFAVGDLFIARTGYTGEDGFEIVLPAARRADAWHALAAAGVKPCGLGARDTLRLEAGMNLYGQDMDETCRRSSRGSRWTVDLASPRDFVGKAALVARRGDAQARRARAGGTGGVLRAHQAVQTPHGDGETTSGTFSPTLARSIALARVSGRVAGRRRGEVDVRGKRLAARVVKPPFVRNGKALV